MSPLDANFKFRYPVLAKFEHTSLDQINAKIKEYCATTDFNFPLLIADLKKIKTNDLTKLIKVVDSAITVRSEVVKDKRGRLDAFEIGEARTFKIKLEERLNKISGNALSTSKIAEKKKGVLSGDKPSRLKKDFQENSITVQKTASLIHRSGHEVTYYAFLEAKDLFSYVDSLGTKKLDPIEKAKLFETFKKWLQGKESQRLNDLCGHLEKNKDKLSIENLNLILEGLTNAIEETKKLGRGIVNQEECDRIAALRPSPRQICDEKVQIEGPFGLQSDFDLAKIIKKNSPIKIKVVELEERLKRLFAKNLASGFPDLIKILKDLYHKDSSLIDLEKLKKFISIAIKTRLDICTEDFSRATIEQSYQIIEAKKFLEVLSLKGSPQVPPKIEKIVGERPTIAPQAIAVKSRFELAVRRNYFSEEELKKAVRLKKNQKFNFRDFSFLLFSHYVKEEQQKRSDKFFFLRKSSHEGFGCITSFKRMINGESTPIQEREIEHILYTIENDKFVLYHTVNTLMGEKSEPSGEKLSLEELHQKFGTPLKPWVKFELLNQEINRVVQSKLTSTSCEVAKKHLDLNRYQDVLPYDETRVQLTNGKFSNEGYYLNGSLVGQYIVTEAPTSKTIKSYWQAIVDQDCALVINLAMPKESGYDYLNENSNLDLGNGWKVKYVKKEHSHNLKDESIEKYYFNITGPNSKDNRSVILLHYINWTDFGVPKNIALLEDLLNEADNWRGLKKVLVHCNAGVGRAGVAVVIDKLKKNKLNTALELNNEVFKTIVEARLARKGMVQTIEQLMFIYSFLQKITGFQLMDTILES